MKTLVKCSLVKHQIHLRSVAATVGFEKASILGSKIEGVVEPTRLDFEVVLDVDQSRGFEPGETYELQIAKHPQPEQSRSPFDKIIGDIREERAYQRGRWGDEHDAKSTPNDWLAYIVYYAGKAVTLPWSPITFRKSLVKVAALCCAAIEWCDRTDGHMAKRHYD